MIYNLICNINLKMMKNEAFSDTEKKEITEQLLSAVSDKDAVSRFHKGVKAPEYLYSLGQSTDKRKMYPMFYITPYNDGKKLRLITGELPKTHILASNHYELEILRILALFDRDNPKVQYMIGETLKRLDTTCYAHLCPHGECVGTGISVIRFLSAVKPPKDEWTDKILSHLFNLYNGGTGSAYFTRVNLPVYYMYSAVPDIKNNLCLEFIESQKDKLADMIGLTELTKLNLNKMCPDTADGYKQIRWHVIKNALGILPEFDYLKPKEE